MCIRHLSTNVALLLAPFALLFATTASAAPSKPDAKVEKAAKALQKKALESDYLATDFGKAQKKLNDAIASCAADKCSPALLASLHRDLGTVLVGANLDRAKGILEFQEALKLDPKTEPTKDFRTKDIDAAFAEAKGVVMPETKKEEPKKKAPVVAVDASGNPSGDFAHTALVEQVVRTPLPIFVEYSGEDAVVRVVARYKGFGMGEFKLIELSKMESGWGANVPCGDVSQGLFQYYLQGFTADNDPVAGAGDRDHTFKVQIRSKIIGEAPHLPGRPAEAQCAEKTDCPPGLQGCGGKSGPMGDPTRDEPISGLKDGAACDEDMQCAAGVCSKEGVCGEPKSAFPRLWVGVGASVNLSFVSSQSSVCSLDSSKTNYLRPLAENFYCTKDGSDFPSRANNAENATIDAAQRGNSVQGGAVLAGTPVYVSLDYALNKSMLVGLRAGYVFGTYQGKGASEDAKRFGLAPLHLMGQFTYILGDQGIMHKGLAPYLMGTAGVSTIDAGVAVSVKVNENVGGVVTPRNVAADAYFLGGPLLLGVGGGARYALSPKAGLLVGLKAQAALGNGFLPMLSPDISLQMGF